MALNRTRALKMADPQEGGGSITDMGPTEVDPRKDACDAAGYFVQAASMPSGGDSLVLYGRTGSVAQVTDTSGSLTMAQTVSVSGSSGGTQHASLPDIIHFLADGGPGDGFASGAVQVTSYVTGTPLPASCIWYTSSAATQPIYTVKYAYTGPLVSSVTASMYNGAGTKIRTVVDTYAYSGPLVSQVTRTWS